MTDLVEAHQPLWQRMQQLLQKQRLAQAFLFVGPRHADAPQFASRFIALLLCEHESPPCGHCRPCRMLSDGAHPDVHFIRQETPGSAIKIEQIRELQQTIFQTPQLGDRRIVVIEPADKMNTSAANALLKILEEPPAHAIFILIAEQIDSIPATILSRCQKYVVPSSPYPPESTESDTIIAGLCELIEGKSSPCTIASQWAEIAFDELLRTLYRITAQAIKLQFIDFKKENNINSQLIDFSQKANPILLFQQLDQIQVIIRKINHTINMNQTLVLEDLLVGYINDNN